MGRHKPLSECYGNMKTHRSTHLVMDVSQSVMRRRWTHLAANIAARGVERYVSRRKDVVGAARRDRESCPLLTANSFWPDNPIVNAAMTTRLTHIRRHYCQCIVLFRRALTLIVAAHRALIKRQVAPSQPESQRRRGAVMARPNDTAGERPCRAKGYSSHREGYGRYRERDARNFSKIDTEANSASCAGLRITDAGEGQGVETAWSVRRIPVHPQLLAGVRARAARRTARLPRPCGEQTRRGVRAVVQVVRQVFAGGNVTAPRMVFHCFRGRPRFFGGSAGRSTIHAGALPVATVTTSTATRWSAMLASPSNTSRNSLFLPCGCLSSFGSATVGTGRSFFFAPPCCGRIHIGHASTPGLVVRWHAYTTARDTDASRHENRRSSNHCLSSLWPAHGCVSVAYACSCRRSRAAHNFR